MSGVRGSSRGVCVCVCIYELLALIINNQGKLGLYQRQPEKCAGGFRMHSCVGVFTRNTDNNSTFM